MAYLYETHLHTSQSSGCSRTKGSEYIVRYQDLGYSGIIVTDHFRGNISAMDTHLPWAEWVHRFCRGYEDAREEGSRRNFDVFFGWEETFDGDDYLIYGLDDNWLLKHPEAPEWTRKQQFEEVRRYGGCVVQAHPFRQHAYIGCIILSTGCVDAVEAVNAGNREGSYDALAWRYAQILNLPVTAGSDMHNAENIRANTVFGVYLDKKMESITDYVNALRTDKKDSRTCTVTGIKKPRDRCDYRGDETIRLPVEIRDRDDRITEQDIVKFLGH